MSGSSPLLAELSRSRGPAMRAAVATLQSDQDRLVRLAPTARMVLRGGPGTGKTVVGLHRAAWLVYNDRRITADRILVVGPSDRFLRFVAAVLPTLGEARITQTTFDRLLGPAHDPGGDERWLALLDRLEAELFVPDAIRVGHRVIPADEVAALMARLARRPPALARSTQGVRPVPGSGPGPDRRAGEHRGRHRGVAPPERRPGLEAAAVAPVARGAGGARATWSRPGWRSTATAPWPTRSGPASRGCRPATRT